MLKIIEKEFPKNLNKKFKVKITNRCRQLILVRKMWLRLQRNKNRNKWILKIVLNSNIMNKKRERKLKIKRRAPKKKILYSNKILKKVIGNLFKQEHQ